MVFEHDQNSTYTFGGKFTTTTHRDGGILTLKRLEKVEKDVEELRKTMVEPD